MNSIIWLALIFIVVVLCGTALSKIWQAGMKAKLSGGRCPFTERCNFTDETSKTCTKTLGMGCFKYKQK